MKGGRFSLAFCVLVCSVSVGNAWWGSDPAEDNSVSISPEESVEHYGKDGQLSRVTLNFFLTWCFYRSGEHNIQYDKDVLKKATAGQDINLDLDKLSAAKANERMKIIFDLMDTNKDKTIDVQELSVRCN